MPHRRTQWSPLLAAQLLAGAIAIAIAGATGCSGGSGPALPQSEPAPGPETVHSAPVSGLGSYHLEVAADGLTASLTPSRASSAVGDTYVVDLSEAFLSNTFNCPDCLRVAMVTSEVVNDEQIVELTFEVRHPFDAPASDERKDLHVTNARLVFLLEGTETFFGYGDHAAVTGDVATIENADGYSVLPAELLPYAGGLSANLFPFRVFATSENDGIHDGAGNFDEETGWRERNTPTGFNVLRMGGSDEVVVRLNLTRAGTLDFETEVALLGDYLVPATPETRLDPTYYMPEGAMAAAWRVETQPVVQTSANAATGTIPLSLEVYDWQHDATVDVEFPDDGNPDGLPAEGGVSQVLADVPAFGDTGHSAPVVTALAGIGRPSVPLEYALTLTRPPAAPVGRHWGLVKVVDDRTSLTGLQRDLETPATLLEVATYQRFAVEVTAAWQVTNLPYHGTLQGDAIVLDDRPWLLVEEMSGGAPTGLTLILTTIEDSPDSANDWVSHTLPAMPADRLVAIDGGPVVLGYDEVGVTHVCFAAIDAPESTADWHPVHQINTLADQTAAMGPVATQHAGTLAIAIRENGYARLVRATVDYPSSTDDYVAASMFEGTPLALASVGGKLSVAYTTPSATPVPAYARALVEDPLGLPDWRRIEFTTEPVTHDVRMAHRTSRPVLWYASEIPSGAQLRLALSDSANPEGLEDWEFSAQANGVDYGVGSVLIGDGHFLIAGMREGLSARQPFAGRNDDYTPLGPLSWEFEYLSTTTNEEFFGDLTVLAARLLRTDTDLFVIQGARDANLRVLQGPPEW